MSFSPKSWRWNKLKLMHEILPRGGWFIQLNGGHRFPSPSRLGGYSRRRPVTRGQFVPGPTAESMAAGRLNQQWDDMRTGYAYNLFDWIPRVFKEAERAPARSPNFFRASDRPTDARSAASSITCGHIDLRAQAEAPSALRSDTPRSISIEVYGAEV